MADINESQRKIQETQPDKLADFSPEKLQSYLAYFLDAHHTFGNGMTHQIRAAEARIAYLQNEIGTRSVRTQSAAQHEQAMGQGSRILYWTKWAVAVGVLVPILVALIAEIPFSRLLPARASQVSPTSSPSGQPTVAPSPTPTPVETPSVVPQASQTPSPTSTGRKEIGAGIAPPPNLPANAPWKNCGMSLQPRSMRLWS